MARIEFVPDVIVPLGVSAANIAAGIYDNGAGINRKYKAQPLVGAAGLALGFAGIMTGRMTNIARPMFHASMPAAALGFYDWIKSQTAPAATTHRGGVAGSGTRIQADPLLQYRSGGL